MNLPWRALLSFLIVLGGMAQTARTSEAVPRVAILPFEQDKADWTLKGQGEMLADRIFAASQDVPGVEWVERSALDKLLAEVEFQPSPGRDSLPVRLGRLLKADILIQGRVSEGDWLTIGKLYHLPLRIEVIDLTNASVLASKNFDWKGPNPWQYPLSLDDAKIREVSATGRQLLESALAQRRSRAEAIAIAPLFFANAGASPRLDAWETEISNALDAAAQPFPKLKLLRFPGVREAQQERDLALLGLTDTDPLAWQRVAHAYLWGRYREIPVEKTTAFEDIEVEMELFLWKRGGDLQRFARTFAVKDFKSAVPPLLREVMESAAGDQPPVGSPDSGQRVAGQIYQRLCELINDGVFATEPKFDWASPSVPPRIIDSIKRLPFGEQKVAYTRRMLEVACFFDPENERLQLLRFLTRVGDSNPARQLLPLAECVDRLQRLVQRPEFDWMLFICRVESGIGFLEWRPVGWWENTEQRQRTIYPPGFDSPRKELVRELMSVIEKQMPALLRRFAEKGSDTAGRRLTANWLKDDWLKHVLQSDLPTESKLSFFEMVWPLIGPYQAPQKDRMSRPLDDQLTASIEKLITDLGDRKRVQSILMASPAVMQSVAAHSPAPNAEPSPRFKFSLSGVHDSYPSTYTDNMATLSRELEKLEQQAQLQTLKVDTLIADLPLTPAPRLHPIDLTKGLSWERWINRKRERWLQPQMTHGRENPFFVASISAFGDQLLLQIGAWSNWPGPTETVRYRISTQTLEPLDLGGPASLCADMGRVLGSQNDEMAWVDLLSDEKADLSFNDGLPVASPVMIGSTGERAVVADKKKGVVGIFDWAERRWFSPPSPAETLIPTKFPEIQDDRLHGDSTRRVEPIVGNRDYILFPTWKLLYNTHSQSWLKTTLRDPGRGITTSGISAALPGWRAFALDGDFWLWDREGITHFSPQANRVVWEAKNPLLQDVCIDGPYLWLLFRPLIEQKNTKDNTTLVSTLRESMLVLLDRASHRAMGVMKMPVNTMAMRVCGEDVWFAMSKSWVLPQSINGGSSRLQRAERTDFYKAFGLSAPTASKIAARPASLRSGNSALYEAILRGEVAVVRQLLEHGASPESTFGYDNTPAVVIAAWTRNIELVQLLIGRGANLEVSARLFLPDYSPLGLKRPDQDVKATRRSPPSGWTALVAAAQQRDTAMTHLLLNAGAKPTELSLKTAITQQNSDVAEALAKAGAPLAGVAQLIVNQSDVETARRLLALKLAFSPEERIELELLAAEAGALPDPALANDLPKLCDHISAAVRENRFEQAAALARIIPASKVREEPPSSIPGGIPPLEGTFRNAAKYGAVPVVSVFLDAGADPSSALRDSTWQPEVLSLLLERGGDPRRADRGEEPFAVAMAASPKAVGLLPKVLDRYGNLDRKFGRGTIGATALTTAALADNAGAVKILLDRGVSPDATDHDGNSALRIALITGSVPVACQLAGAGASLELKDPGGRTVLDALRDSGEQFFIRLRKYDGAGEDENRGTRRLIEAIDGRPSFSDLAAAVTHGDIAAVKSLLARGAPVRPPCAYFRDSNENAHVSPGLVYLGVKTGSRELVKVLLDHGCDPNVGQGGLVAWIASGWREHYGLAFRQERYFPADRCKTPLIAAAEAGDIDLVRSLLAAGAYAPARDEYQRDALDAAATREIARLIDESTTAQYAAEKLIQNFKLGPATGKQRDMETIRQIAASKPQALRTRTASGGCPLSMLYENGLRAGSEPAQFAILAALHDQGVRFDVPDFFGTTPLHRAVLEGSPEEVASLLKLGFDPEACDAWGFTSMQLAQNILDENVRRRVLAALKQPAL